MVNLRSYRTLLAIAVLAIGATFAVQSADAATFNIINLDGPGEGFNDTTPASPVGGNPGTTLGQQRLNCFIRAGEIWGAILQSNVTISIDANMDPLFCDATSAVLGSAGPNTVHYNFSGAPLSNVWYVQATANSIAGVDLSPANSDGGMTFNSNLDGSPGCLGGLGWYLGFDESPTGGDIDFVTVLVHEMGHVLGFLTLINPNGSLFNLRHDTYEWLMYHDGATPPDYPSMTQGQRAVANLADPNLVFDGTSTNNRAAAIPLTTGLVNGRTRLHGPNPYQGGSSLSHFSTAVSPNQIMEPSYTGPDHSPDLDVNVMEDIGWTLLAAGPTCSVTPTSLNFGTVTVGSSADLGFTITNTGGGTLSGSVSESCADYSIVSGGGSYSLSAGQSRAVTVRFQPLSSGVKPCTIETGDALCSDVTCTGIGEDPPACSVTPTSLDFGTVTVGLNSDLIFTIKNTGGGLLTGSVSESCPDFDLEAGGGPYSLAAGESLQVTVQFDPLSSGVKNCTIETGDALCSDVSCTGIAEDPPACSVVPASLDFGTVTVGNFGDDTFTIKNTGGGLLSGTVSEACPDYEITDGGGAYALAASESLIVTVRFEPASAGVKPCTIETGDALCSDVSCTGIGEDPPACSVVPTSLDFGTITVGNSSDDTFTIKNTGGGLLSGTVSEACPDYEITDGGGPYALAPGESLQVTVRFEPATSGVKPCTIETGDALCSDVTCTGTGEDPAACVVTPTSIDFGTVDLGSVKDTTFTIKNTGGGTLVGDVSEACPDYELILGGGPYTLAAGESLTVTVRFEPTSDGEKLCTIETGDALCSDVDCTGDGYDPLTGIGPNRPNTFALDQNHPNPFNPSTRIGFSLETEAMVSLIIYDVSGTRVRTLVNRSMSAGPHTEEWDARDDQGRSVASGIYFYRLTSGNQTLTRKAVLLR